MAMTLFRSLTNRIFFGSALLAVASIAIAIYNVNRGAAARPRRSSSAGLDEAGHRSSKSTGACSSSTSPAKRGWSPTCRGSRPRSTPNIRTTVAADREEYQRAAHRRPADRHRASRTRCWPKSSSPRGSATGVVRRDARRHSRRRRPGGELLLAAARRHPAGRHRADLDRSAAARDPRDAERRLQPRRPGGGALRSLTNSDIAFGIDGTIRASTLPPDAVARALSRSCRAMASGNGSRSARQEYIAKTRALSATLTRRQTRKPADAAPARRGQGHHPALAHASASGFLNPLHRRLAVIAVVAVLAATLLSYAIARTVTRPLGAITATMREMAATGDLTRRILRRRRGATWEDEDARLLATTFNTMTDSIARFQREAAQRERLSSLGRLSTVVAHEIRNPLMIIKTALRSLRAPTVTPEDLRTAAADIDEETDRLNRLVSEVLDFAKPIKFDLAPADVNALCEDAGPRRRVGRGGDPVALELDWTLPHHRHRRRAAARGAGQHSDERPPRGRRTRRGRSGRDPVSVGRAGMPGRRVSIEVRIRARALQLKISRECSTPTSRPDEPARDSGSPSRETSSRAWAAPSACRAGRARGRTSRIELPEER